MVLSECMAGRNELITELQTLADKLGETPRAKDMDNKGGFTTSHYQSEFGTWNDALRAAGLELNQHRGTNKTKQDFINDLQNVAEKVGRTPRLGDVKEHGEWSTITYKKQITDGNDVGEWNDVLRQSGFEPYYEIRNTITKTCRECNKEFEVKEYNSDIDYCSKSCYYEWRKGKYTGKASWAYNSNTVNCDQCGEPTEKKLSRLKERENHFCSHNCYAEWISENKTGKDAFRFSGGRAEYGPGFNLEKKEKVRKRDDHCCQVCGITQQEHLKQEGRKLSVHHIIPAKQFEDPDKRNDMGNLVTLCESDHKKWEGIPLKPQLKNQ